MTTNRWRRRMGLDITAYRQLKPALEVELDESGYPKESDKYWKPGAAVQWAEENWPGRTEGIDSNTIYEFAKDFNFRAGSYGGYNRWRDMLAKLAGYGSAGDAWNLVDRTFSGPFIELIDFADNEGVIGPKISAKLAKDFRDYEVKAKEFAETSGESWFWEKYQNWKKAFEMAADNGAVDFH